MGSPAGLAPLGRTRLPPPRRRPSRPPRRCRKRQTNRTARAGLISARPFLWGGGRTRPRPSVLPYGQNLDAGAIHLPRADEKEWGPRRVLTRWGGRTSRRPGEGHDGTPERAQRKRVAMGKEEQGSGMRNSRQAVPKRADFATTRRCRKRQTNRTTRAGLISARPFFAEECSCHVP